MRATWRPLPAWPYEPRDQQRSSFAVSWAKTLAELEKEIDQLEGSDVVIGVVEKLNAVATSVLEALAARDIVVTRWTAFQEAEDRWARARIALSEAYLALELEAPVDDLLETADPRRAVDAPVTDDVAPPEPASAPRPAAEPPPADVEPTPAPVTASRRTRGNDGLARQQRRILESAVRYRGDLPRTAEAAGTNVNNVRTVLHNIGKRGLLPIELIGQLPAGYAKYTGATP